MLDELRSLCLHCTILLDAVAMGNNDHTLDSVQSRGHGDSLSVIAARRRHHAFKRRLGLAQPLCVNQRAAQLKSSYRRVVLMLDPDLSA